VLFFAAIAALPLRRPDAAVRGNIGVDEFVVHVNNIVTRFG
jgi:hypothetical protein